MQDLIFDLSISWAIDSLQEKKAKAIKYFTHFLWHFVGVSVFGSKLWCAHPQEGMSLFTVWHITLPPCKRCPCAHVSMQMLEFNPKQSCALPDRTDVTAEKEWKSWFCVNEKGKIKLNKSNEWWMNESFFWHSWDQLYSHARIRRCSVIQTMQVGFDSCSSSNAGQPSTE